MYASTGGGTRKRIERPAATEARTLAAEMSRAVMCWSFSTCPDWWRKTPLPESYQKASRAARGISSKVRRAWAGGRVTTTTSHSAKIAACSFQVWRSRNASSPSTKTRRVAPSASARSARSVSIEYDGPGRSSSTRETRNPGTPATASSTMRRRGSPAARPRFFGGGAPGPSPDPARPPRRRVHLGEEAARGAVVLGDDCLGEARRVARDEGEGGVERGHDGDAEHEVQVLGVPVGVGGGFELGDEGAARRIAAQLAAARAERGGDPGQELRRDRLVHEQVLDRVAHARPLDLRVEADALRHGEVGALVHVEVADALEVLHHRDAALFEDGVLERLAAARDDYVDAVVALEQPARHLASALDQLHGRGGQPGGLDLGAERPRDGAVRRLRLGAALEQHGVRGLETERGRVGGHVWARFVDREHDADRHAHLRDLEAVRPPPGGDRLAHGIGERGDLLETARHGVDAAGGQREAVDEGCAVAGGARAGDVVRVGAEDGGLVAPQARGREIGRASCRERV